MRVLTCSISVGIHQFTSILDIWFMLCYKVTWTLTAGLGPVTLLEKRRGKKTKEKKRKAVSLKSRKNPTHAPKRACHARRHFASGQACDKIYNVSVSLQSWVQQCSKYVHAVQSMINLHTMMEEAGHAHTLFVWFLWGLCRSVRSVLIEQTHKLRNSDIFTTRKYKCIQLLLTVDSCMTSERAEIWEPNQFLCETRLDLWRSLLIIGIHSDVTLK